MARINAQKPTPDDALEEARTKDFIRFFSRAPHYDDPHENDQENDDDLYTPDEHSWLRRRLRGGTNRPDDDGYIY